MDSLLKAGRIVVALALIGFGVAHFVFAHAPSTLASIAPHDAMGLATSWTIGLVMLGAGSALLVDRQTHIASGLLAAVLLLDVAILHLPGVAVHPRDGQLWTPAFETLALASVLLLIAGTQPAAHAKSSTVRLLNAGRVLLAISLLVFGAQHFLYLNFVTGMVPVWLPARAALAAVAGVVFIGTACSILVHCGARISGVALALEFALFMVLLHIPTVARNPVDGSQWGGLLMALSMMGGGLLVAGGASGAMRESAE